jgi:hypothetical protein
MFARTTSALQRWILMVLVTLAFAGCTDSPAGPERLAGRYTLYTVAGQGLPAILYEGMEEDAEEGAILLRIMVESGFIELIVGGRYEQRLVTRAYVNDVPSLQVRWVDRGVFTQTDSALAFESTLIQNVAFSGTGTPQQVSTRQDLLRYLHGESRVTSFSFER